MTPPPLNLLTFERELATQCRFGIEAAAEMNAARQEKNRFVFFRRAQSFLAAVACVSKLFWPGKAKGKARGEALRALFLPNRDLLWQRDLRNDYEHFDERLDDWAVGERVYIDLLIGAGDGPNLGIGASQNSHCYLRNYDRNSETLRFWDNAVAVKPLVQELTRIEAAVRTRGHLLLQDFKAFPRCPTCGSDDLLVPTSSMRGSAPDVGWHCLVDGTTIPR